MTVMNVSGKSHELPLWPKQHLIPQDKWMRLSKVDRKMYEKIKTLLKALAGENYAALLQKHP